MSEPIDYDDLLLRAANFAVDVPDIRNRDPRKLCRELYDAIATLRSDNDQLREQVEAFRREQNAHARREGEGLMLESQIMADGETCRRYFLDRDNSGHWYVVPVSMAEKWDQWVSLPEDDERSWDAPEWVKTVGGSQRLVTFTEPEVQP